MPEVLTESACKILLRLANDSRLVLVKPPRQGFWSLMPLDLARAALSTGNSENRVGQKFQTKVVDRLFYAGFIRPGPFEQVCEITELGKKAAAEIADETRHPSAQEAIARRSIHARA